MRHERTFEIGVPVGIAHRHWRRFGETSESPSGGQVRFEPVGESRTRVRLALEQEPERVEKTVEDFINFVERHGDAAESAGSERGETHEPTDSEGGELTRKPGESGLPLVGKLASPGPPGSGIAGAAAVDKPAPKKRD